MLGVSTGKKRTAADRRRTFLLLMKDHCGERGGTDLGEIGPDEINEAEWLELREEAGAMSVPWMNDEVIGVLLKCFKGPEERIVFMAQRLLLMSPKPNRTFSRLAEEVADALHLTADQLLETAGVSQQDYHLATCKGRWAIEYAILRLDVNRRAKKAAVNVAARLLHCFKIDEDRCASLLLPALPGMEEPHPCLVGYSCHCNTDEEYYRAMRAAEQIIAASHRLRAN